MILYLLSILIKYAIDFPVTLLTLGQRFTSLDVCINVLKQFTIELPMYLNKSPLLSRNVQAYPENTAEIKAPIQFGNKGIGLTAFEPIYELINITDKIVLYMLKGM